MTLFVWTVSILLSLFLLLTILYLKISNIKNPLKLGTYFFILHCIIVTVFGIKLYSLLRIDDLYWIYFTPLCIIDFPISLLNGLISYLVETHLIYFSFNMFFLIYIFILGFFGSIQYFLIGVVIGKVYNKRLRKT